VAIDVDEVLAQYLKGYTSFLNDTGGTQLKVSDFHTYKFWEVTGRSREEEVEQVYAYHETAFFRELEPVPGACEAVSELAALAGVELHVVTSRQENITEATHDWLGRHFPGVFPRDRVHIGNHFGKEGAKVSKPEMCARIGAGVLVDDSLDYCRELAEAGTPALLFDLAGGYGWNQGPLPHELVARVTGWGDAVARIKERCAPPLSPASPNPDEAATPTSA